MIAYDITLGADAVKITVIGILQAAGIFALAPLLTGVMRKVKAKRQKRVGASVIQPYYDLLKLLKKDEGVSEHASWVFQWTPWIVAASTMSAALFIPIFVPFSPVSSAGDILVVLGTIVWTMLAVRPHYRWVAIAQVPYLVWVSIATVLQLTITARNG